MNFLIKNLKNVEMNKAQFKVIEEYGKKER